MPITRLKELRKEKEISFSNFAKTFNIGESTLSRWENGVNEPDTNTLCSIADYFGVSVDYLLGKTDDPRPFPPDDTRTIEERWNDPNNKFLYAMYGEVKELDDKDKEDILDFVDYLKSRKK